MSSKLEKSISEKPFVASLRSRNGYVAYIMMHEQFVQSCIKESRETRRPK
ncbi:hypothetical protein H7906_09430 [Staphylococcus capitis]|nr:hypothetical protein [Staphylococcus capitis]MBO0376103.1 hypothetical protein [Staphylococcus capitis]MDI0029474.1 hypothetical protein [Staphylococcus capitis]